jgi:hypothetical protein
MLLWLLIVIAALQGSQNAQAFAADQDTSQPHPGVARPAAPQEIIWSNFAPTGWITTSPFSVSVTASSSGGLDTGDAYSISTDGGASWSAWTTANLSIDAPDASTHNLTVTNLSLPDSASLNYIRFRVFETGVGEAISPTPYLIQVDATPPGAPQGLTPNPSSWTNQNSFAVTWTNPYDVSPIAGARYKLDSVPTGPTDGTYVATTSSISNIAVSGDGAHTIYVWLVDGFGRADHNNRSSAALRLDTTPPEPPSRFSGSPDSAWTNVNNFSETWKNPSDLSGITGAYYKLNMAPTSPLDGKFVRTTDTITGIQVPGNGQHDIHIWLVDAAGNADYTAFGTDADVFWYDETPPVSSASITPATPPATGWYTTSVTIRFAATDQPVDPAYPPVVYYRLNSGEWTAATELNIAAEGSHRLLYQARDKAGNSETAREMLIGIDRTAPTTTLTADRVPAASGWYTAPVTYTLTVTDSVSGNPKGFYRVNEGPWQNRSSFTLSSEGTYRIEYYGQDAAGNRSPLMSTEARVDIVPPATGRTVEGTTGENGWYTSAVTMRLLPVDTVSGVAMSRYRTNLGAWQTGTELSLSDGVHEAEYYSIDVAGNAEKTVTSTLKVDRVAPTAPVALTASPTGWSRTNAFAVQWTSPADLSLVNGAYVKLSNVISGTAPSGPRDGTLVSQTSRIENLTVPGEGAYRLYLWLRDTAGNVDHRSAPVNGPVLRYDATLPVTSAELQGTEGELGWFRSPTQVTLTATDTASGVSALNWRVDDGAWQTIAAATVSFTIDEPGEHVVEHYAQDAAGNLGAPAQSYVKIDMTAPGAPADVRAFPAGWSQVNSYRIEWLEMNDPSGISGAYVKFNSPPAHSTDGQFYAGESVITDVAAPSEGKHAVYVWLRDNAGNADHSSAVAITEAMWYDATPPITDISVAATPGSNGWYVEPVTFNMSADDATSGVKHIRVQVDDGPWQVVGTTYVLWTQGRHIVRIGAVDHAGNIETPHQYEFKVDSIPPLAVISGPHLYESRTRFTLNWGATDNASGVDAYDVQVRRGYSAPWQAWLQGTRLTSAQFDAERSDTLFFRVFARDSAGNRQMLAQELRVMVESIANGGFETGNFSSWEAGGELFLAVVPTPGPNDAWITAARLGDADYGPSLPPVGMVPVGSARITQSIRIPDANQMREPRLQFRYRVLSYDVMFSPRMQRYVDTLEATLLDEQGNEIAMLLRAGNPGAPPEEWGALYDSGWQYADLDLRPYAGRSVTLSIANWNRNDNLLNTWSFVDQIQIRELLPTYLPIAQQSGVPGGASGQSSAAPATASPSESSEGDSDGLR